VIAYREDSRTVRTRDELHRLAAARDALTRAPRDQDAALAYLISIGELEASIGDAIFVDGDCVDDRAAALREVTLDAAALYLDTSAVAACVPTPNRHPSAFDALRSLDLPEQVSIRTSEGYAYYSLFPETYAESARRFVRETAPQRVCVIGIRSIGTSLSAIVAAALSDVPHVRAFTVRPGGHPFDRQLTVAPSLERA